MRTVGKLVKAYGNMREKSVTIGLILGCTKNKVYVYQPLLQRIEGKLYRIIAYTQEEFKRFLSNPIEGGCFKLSKPPKQYLQRRTHCNFVNYIYRDLYK